MSDDSVQTCKQIQIGYSKSKFTCIRSAVGFKSGDASVRITKGFIQPLQNGTPHLLFMGWCQYIVRQRWVSLCDHGDKLLRLIFSHFHWYFFVKNYCGIFENIAVNRSILGKGNEIKIVGIRQFSLFHNTGTQLVDIKLVFGLSDEKEISLELFLRASDGDE